MPTTADFAGAPPGALAMFLTGLGFAPVGVAPLPISTAFAWFLLQTPPRHYDRELQILSGLARLLTRESVRRGLLQASDTATVLATIDLADQPPPGAATLTPQR